MNLKEIAQELVAGCREHRERENLDKLYAPDAVSVEAVDMGGTGRETHGLAGIHGKHDWWEQNHEVTGGKVEGPYLHGDDQFAVIFSMQGRTKADGKTFDMTEVGIYHVAKGKIVREEFYYPS